jgi:DNA-binding response OmpR family regulator
VARVLIVDDDASIADLMKATCELDHHEVRVATDEDQGVAAYHEFGPDVMILDLTMQGGGCREVVARLRERLGHEPCRWIVVTGHALSRDESEFDDLGAAAVLPKPFGIADLRRVVAEVTRGGG